jgi:malate dehydrogenase (oxaloacetate-decarboxylating)
LAVLNSPLLNKGSAFTAEERGALGLAGLLPPDISTLGAQVRHAYIQYERLPDSLSKNVYLTTLHDRNEVLFYRLFSEHLREMIPIVNDLTVGRAIEQYHHECRPPTRNRFPALAIGAWAVSKSPSVSWRSIPRRAA